MPDYRRAFAPGGTFFFTLVTFGRAPILLGDAARLALRRAVERTRRDHPFALDAIVVLPDHLHAVWTLPEGDADFSTRWRLIKSRFTREWLTTEAARADGAASRPLARASRGERAVWQPRYWEHLIRDEGDLARHLDYVHYNPVKHGHAPCPHAWPWSTFSKQVALNHYDEKWCCACAGPVEPPDFGWADGVELE